MAGIDLRDPIINSVFKADKAHSPKCSCMWQRIDLYKPGIQSILESSNEFQYSNDYNVKKTTTMSIQVTAHNSTAQAIMVL